MRIRDASLTALLLLLGATFSVAGAASGELDTDFDEDGVWAAYQNGILHIVVQSSDKIVVMDERDIFRLNTDGSLDSDFAEITQSGGLPFDTSVTDGDTETELLHVPYSMIVDGDDHLFITGVRFQRETTTKRRGKKTTTEIHSSDFHLFVAKLDADGAAVSSFGTNGVASFDLEGSSYERGRALALQSDGSIVVAGVAEVSTTSTDDGGGGKGNGKGKKGSTTTTSSSAILLLRFTASGSLDTTFGEDAGYTLHDRTSGSDEVLQHQIGIQSNGAIVLASDSGSTEWVITRYGADGAIDSAFGAETREERLEEIAILGDDSIVAVGVDNTSSDIADDRALVLRYGENGGLDTTFGSNGFADLGISGRSYALGVHVDDSGTTDRILVAAVDSYLTTVGGTQEWSFDSFVVRLDADGDVDSSFGSSGRSDPVMGYDANYVNSLAMDAQGRILGAGNFNEPGVMSVGWLLVRWLGD